VSHDVDVHIVIDVGCGGICDMGVVQNADQRLLEVAAPVVTGADLWIPEVDEVGNEVGVRGALERGRSDLLGTVEVVADNPQLVGHHMFPETALRGGLSAQCRDD
jgi:hypothetical protein